MIDFETKITPKAKRGAGLEIGYCRARFLDREILLGRTGKRLCYAGFGAEAEIILEHFPRAVLGKEPQLPPELATALTDFAEGRPCAQPLYAEGTAFQIAVWTALLDIPFGGTCRYLDIAAALQKPDATRAVGGAVGANPLSLFIPCHRVLHQNARDSGYAWGTDLKMQILALEQRA